MTDTTDKASGALRQAMNRSDEVAKLARPTCSVGGMIRPGAMCGQVIVGGKLCGYSGECQHKSAPPKD